MQTQQAQALPEQRVICEVPSETGGVKPQKQHETTSLMSSSDTTPGAAAESLSRGTCK